MKYLQAFCKDNGISIKRNFFSRYNLLL